MRYQSVTTTHANRPKKKEKLPPGAAYTCVAQGERIVGLAVDPDMEKDERMSGVESDSDSDNVRGLPGPQHHREVVGQL